MKEDGLKVPTAKILLGITVLNVVLVAGGTLFSIITIKSIQSNYDKSLAAVRASDREREATINLLENVSAEADVINARISASIKALTADVKLARDKQILMIEGEADYVVEAAVEARSRIRDLEQEVDLLALTSKDNLSLAYNDFKADLLVEHTHAKSLGEGLSHESKNIVGRMLVSQTKVIELSERSKLELQKLNQRTIELSQKLRSDMLRSVAVLSETENQTSEIIDEGIAQFRSKLSQSEAELAATVHELEDIRLALQIGQEMMDQAPAAGKSSSKNNEIKKRPETD